MHSAFTSAQTLFPNALHRGHMNRKLWSGFTTALLVTAFGPLCMGQLEPVRALDQASKSNPSASTEAAEEAERFAESVVKVGTSLSDAISGENTAAVAKIQAHALNGNQAATVYVRDIPVVTFLSNQAAPLEVSGQTRSSADDVKVASAEPVFSGNKELNSTEITANPNDPVWRATEAAAQINQLHRNNLDATAINVRWDASRKLAVIKVGDDELLPIDRETQLPDTTKDPDRDAIQITNRLRRLLGNAPPVKDISGKPAPAPTTVALGPVRLRLTGLASWYGPGFHGNQSASGEIFNQNALTAAHRSLPFGTMVRVTNLDNGRSVVVRINDRGPYSGGRIIDLSAGAAQMVGMMQTGVAPVQLDVIDGQSAMSAR